MVIVITVFYYGLFNIITKVSKTKNAPHHK